MPAVDAFVGHSFTEDDEAVVEAFLSLFRSFAATQENFRWDHARKAESKNLSEKVLEKIEGKNTFRVTLNIFLLNEANLNRVFYDSWKCIVQSLQQEHSSKLQVLMA